MPELPEVETIRLQLAPRLEGRSVERMEIVDPRWCAPLAPQELVLAVEGRAVRALRRRGKYLVVGLSGAVYLVMHLRMTGTLLYDAPAGTSYTRVRVAFDDGHSVVFADPRRFGTGQLVVGDDALDEFLAARLGVEPFSSDFTAEHLRALGRASRVPIKAFLLDQRRIAGVGNIYADEALFRAQLHPLRQAGRLTTAQWRALRVAVRDTLRAGIEAGGATIDDFRHLDGARGSFQDRFLVHRRAGEPCPRCGTLVRKLVAAGRGTYVCERCQVRPRTRSGRQPSSASQHRVESGAAPSQSASSDSSVPS